MGMPPDFEQLIRQHGARIRRIARRYAASSAVDDLMQDILVRLWRSYPGFRSDAKVETWIYRVALNASMTHVRDSIRAQTAQSAVAAAVLPLATAPAASSMADILESFLARLGDIDASILMMYLDGLTPEEISGVLGIAANTISVRINRLKQKFSDTYID
jgi:RNA polymerase sigma-70 factor (ECF subfamily)